MQLLADATFLYKAINRIINVDIRPYVDFYSIADRHSFRHYNDLFLRSRYARTNFLRYSFFHRIVNTWHLLPQDIRKATSVN